jgi:FAD/FMN-containing dehydrogenase
VNGIIASLAALMGTRLGAVLTYVFQARNTRQAQEFAQVQQFRQEKLDACSSFAGALTNFRRSENDRWHRGQEDAESKLFLAARDESYQLRAAATAAMCRLQLVCADDKLSQLAERALHATEEIHYAANEDDRATRGKKARLALQDFLSNASAHLR